MMKKHLVEAVVPVLIELRRMLGEARHPLLGALMATTAALLKEYKAEIEDILVADKQVGRLGRAVAAGGRRWRPCYGACRRCRALRRPALRRAGVQLVARQAAGGS
jgi:hypothetical protein